MINSGGVSWFSILSILFMFQTGMGFSYPGEFYEACGSNFSCGNAVVGIGYPFLGSKDPPYCGHPGFKLKCEEENSVNITTMDIMNMTYRVLRIDQIAQTMTIAREDLMVGICPEEMVNTTLDFSLFDYVLPYMNITYLYGCPDSNLPSLITTMPCGKTGYDPTVYALPGTLGPGNCEKSVTVPVPISRNVVDQRSINISGLGTILQQGLEVKWKTDSKPCSDCKESNGQCGYNLQISETTCFCPDPPFMSHTCAMAKTSSAGGNSKSKVGMNIGLSIAGAVLAGLGLAYLIMCCRKRRKQRNLPLAVQTSVDVSKDISTPPSSNPLSTPSSKFTASIPSYPSSNSELGRGSSYFGVQVFNYTELEQATDNFNPSKELGEGGFGTVYYGELPDGRVIAVKRLFENNYRRVEQFMNEVEILTQLRHPNLVTLHGCTSRRSRELLLVYEYIPNGTVADHVHGKRAKSGLLSWPVRLNIAIETAEALAYLHNSEIIHRDVKTNNILLDNNFHVKVADFGLSRLFPTDVTHVSTAPQGTPGYVDPEYHQCYQLTEKSDVYSFGVVLIELISSLLAVDTSRHRHDINLSNMAVTKIQNHALHEMVDPSLGFETNSGVRRRITLVAELAFRCLQQERDMRPSMAEVLESMKRIRDDSSNAHMVEVVDILVDEDETGPLKDGIVPPPPPEA